MTKTTQTLTRARVPASTRTTSALAHHADYPERMSDDELKQSALVMATFAWQAAMAAEKIRVCRSQIT